MADGRVNKNDLITDEAIQQVEKLKKDLDLAVESLIALTKQVNELSPSLNKMVGNIQSLSKAEQEQIKNEQESTILKNKILKQNIDLQKAEIDLAKKKEQANKVSKENNEIAKLNTIINDKQTGGIEKLKAQIKLLYIERNKLLETDVNYSKNIEKANKKIAEHETKLKSLSSATEIQRTKIGGYQEALQNLPGPLGAASNAIGGMIKQMWLFVANPIGLVIAGIAAGLGLLYKSFTATDEGANMLNGTLKATGNVLDILLDRTISYYKMLYAFKGFKWDDIKKNAVDAFGGIGKAIRDAAKAGYNYVQVMDDIDDRETASLSRTAKMRVEIETLKNLTKDKTKADEERSNAAQLAFDKEIELLTITKNFEEEKTQAETRNLSSKINNNKLSLAEKEKELNKWLEVDDKELASLLAKDKAFAEFYNKNEDDFKNIQKLKANEIILDSDFQKETRRLQTELNNFKNEIIENEKKKLKDSLDFKISLYNNGLKNQLIQLDLEKEKKLKKANELGISELEVIKWYNSQKNKLITEDNKKQQGIIDISISNQSKIINDNLEDQLLKFKTLKGNESAMEYKYLLYKILIAKKDVENSKASIEKKRELIRSYDLLTRNLNESNKKAIEDEAKTIIDNAKEAYQKRFDAAQESGLGIDDIEKQRLDSELEGMKTLIEQFKVDDETKKEMLKEYDDYDKKLKKANKDFTKKTEAEKKKAIEDTIKASTDLLTGIADLSATFNDRKIQELEVSSDKQLNVLEQEKATRIKNGEDEAKVNEDISRRKEEIEKKTAIEIAKARRKQAVMDKTASIIQAIINTALGVTQAIAQGGIFGIITGAIVAAAGAIQIAQIAAQPLPEIPAFWKGTKDAPGGLSLVSELGTEGIKTPDGKFYLSPETPTLIDLPKHSEVIPNNLLQQELAKYQLTERTVEKIQGYDNSKLDELISTVKNKKELHVNITQHGFGIYTKSANSRTKWIEKYRE